MEIRQYAAIIWRRAWLVVLIVGIMILYVGYEFYHLYKTPGALTGYSSNVTIEIGLRPSPNGLNASAADNVSVAETLADAMTLGPLLSSKAFDTQVSQQISSNMSAIEQKFGANPNLGSWQDPSAIGGALSATRTDTLVTITANWSTPAGAWAIATAVGEVSSNNLCSYLDYVVAQRASCSTSANSDLPAVSAQVLSAASDPGKGTGTQINKAVILVILLIVALIVALALALLVDYLDDRIYSKDEAARLLQLPVYAEIPRPPSAGRAKPRVPHHPYDIH